MMRWDYIVVIVVVVVMMLISAGALMLVRYPYQLFKRCRGGYHMVVTMVVLWSHDRYKPLKSLEALVINSKRLVCVSGDKLNVLVG